MDVNEFQPGQFCWVELSTSDDDAAKSFYSSLFGWSVQEMPIPNGVYNMMQLRGRTAAAIMKNPQAPVAWMSYVATDDVDASANKAKELGGTIIVPPMDAMEAGRFAVFTDPQGAALSLWKRNKTKGLGVFGEPGALVWVELATRDTDAAKKFYTSLFGWTTKQNQDSTMEYTEWHIGERGIGGMFKIRPDMGDFPPCWLPYFMVDDVDASAQKATSLGGKVQTAPADIPNVGRFATVSDPQGAMFYLFKPNM